MKFSLYLILMMLLSPFFMQAQELVNGTIMIDGVERAYILYLPASYDGSEEYPLVFNFHGFGSNATEQLLYGDFRPQAEAHNFIVVHPEGLLYNGTTHWNVGGFTVGSTVNDIGFTHELLADLDANYNINTDRVYSTGMSNGGFMSLLLACQLSEEFAAVASVTGSMSPTMFNACNAQHPMPVMQIHGTSDQVVPYTGAAWTKPVGAVVDYWVDYNEADDNATIVNLEDVNTTDMSTVQHFTHANTANYATVEHYKVLGGDHTWPGTALVFAGTNLDFDASKEIWRFFSQYDINGKIVTSNDVIASEHMEVYPNPMSHSLTVSWDYNEEVRYEILSTVGQLLSSGVLKQGNNIIDMSPLPPNIYYLKVGQVMEKIMKL